jgi:hypothetical protein
MCFHCDFVPDKKIFVWLQDRGICLFMLIRHYGKNISAKRIFPRENFRGTTSRQALRSKALAVFAGSNEGLDHLGVNEAAVVMIELAQPEVVARVQLSALQRID